MAYGKIKCDTITYDDSGDVDLAVSSLGPPEGTAVKSTTNSNEAATKFLRADGDGTCSWNVIPAASSITVADESSDTTCFPLFVTAATGDLAPKTGSNITFNSSTGLLTAVGLTLSGDLTVNGTTTTIDTDNTTIKDNLLELNSGASSNANDSGILIERGSTGDNAIIAWDESADKFIVGTTTATASSTGNLTIAAGTLQAEVLEDGKGDVRIIPQLTKSSQHTIVASDHGKHSINSSGGWIFNTSTGFTAGQAITLINNSGSDQTITATGTTLYNAADGSTPTKLGKRGMATAICTASNTYYLSGAGLS